MEKQFEFKGKGGEYFLILLPLILMTLFAQALPRILKTDASSLDGVSQDVEEEYDAAPLARFKRVHEKAFMRMTEKTSVATTIVSLIYGLYAIIMHILFGRKFFPKLFLGAAPFSFAASIKKYFWLSIGQTALMVVTFGVYYPWGVKKIYGYYIDSIRYNDMPFKFIGTGGALFKTVLFTLLFPALFLALFAGVTYYIGQPLFSGEAAGSATANIAFLALLTSVGCAFYCCIFAFLARFFAWSLEVTVGDRFISLERHFASAAGYMLGQFLLTVCTMGIYFPVASINVVSYFANRIVMHTKDGVITGRIRFMKARGRGFLLLWGQTLLTIVTLGVYLPWAICRIVRFFAECASYARAEEGARA